MNISIIAATDKNGVIGKSGKMPWYLPADLAYFKKVTLGHTVVMGRKTYEAIGRALEGRRNIVITSNRSFTAENCEIAHSMEQLFNMLDCIENEVFIIGGAKVYKQFLPYCDKLYITRLDHSFDGDTYFPTFNIEEWDEISVSKGVTDELNPFTYYYCIYRRK